MRSASVIALLLLSLLVSSGAARAGGLTLELVGTDSGQAIHQTVYVWGQLLASEGEMVDASGQLAPRAMIFDGDKNTVTVIDPTRGTYRVLDEAALREMGQRMAAARAQMMSRVATAPTAQRAAMTAVLERHGVAGELDLAFSSTGEKKKVGGVACQVQIVTDHGRPFETACLASWSSGPVKKTELAVVHQLSDLLRITAPAMEQATVAVIDRFPGFPVERTQPPVGALGERTTTLKRVTRGPVAASHFAVPAGLREETAATPSPRR